MQTRNRWYGPEALDAWGRDRVERGRSTRLDVVLLTHPRDERDMSMLYPFANDLTIADRRRFAHSLQPVCGEVIETPDLAIGLMFVMRFADEMMDPRSRGGIRDYFMHDGLEAVAATGARVVCLGGLLGALSGYGKRVGRFASKHHMTITTGHSTTAVAVLETYQRAVRDLELDVSASRMALLGAGSVGAAFARLLAQDRPVPDELVVVDRPERASRVEALAAELRGSGVRTRVELTDRRGQLSSNSACYDSAFLISAVSTPEVIDIGRVAPRTVLVDDSQPNCWSREGAWRRVQDAGDIAPCEAGLVEARSIGYWSYFPFRFASEDPAGGTSVAWCCLVEGLAMSLDPSLPPTVGEPEVAALTQHLEGFKRLGLGVAPLQCGSRFLPIARLRCVFAGKLDTAVRRPIALAAGRRRARHIPLATAHALWA